MAREGTRTDENRRMLAAFRWNLRVLSYIALAVGAFLIYNTISVSVVRRRFEIGILRALGATRGASLGSVSGEAASFGFLGGIAGLALGRLMAEGAVKLVAATVELVVCEQPPWAISLTWEIALLAFAMGVGVRWYPPFRPLGKRRWWRRWRRWRAAAANMKSRRASMEGFSRMRWRSGDLRVGRVAARAGERQTDVRLSIGGLVDRGVGARHSRAGAAIVRRRGWYFARVFGVEALLATRSLAGSLRRTSVLVGALSTAIAMLAAVGIMVGSFRETVLLWMEDRLQADLYLRPAVPAGADRHPTMSAGYAGAAGEAAGGGGGGSLPRL